MTDRVDTIVFGGSAGSLTALKCVVAGLGPDLPAALFVCQHLSVLSDARRPEILARHTDMPVREAVDGMPIEFGTITVAPPDTHMMIGAEHVHLRRGAHENNFRPAIDPLFRSAAVYRATRAVGVVLSGLLDDGAAGARAMARTGGTVLVQDPETAEYPDMPRAALRAAEAARPIPLGRMAEKLRALVGSPAAPAPPIPWEIGLEVKIASLESASMSNEDRLGELSPFNCPHCDGVLWEIEDGPLTRYRCHTGHAYTSEALNVAQDEALDHQLFSALRAHRGRAELLRRMSLQGGEATRELIRRRIALVEEDAARLEAIIRNRSGTPASRSA